MAQNDVKGVDIREWPFNTGKGGVNIGEGWNILDKGGRGLFFSDPCQY